VSEDHLPPAHASLNHALASTNHCPHCGAAAPALTIAFPRSLHCTACGFRAFFNPKPVAATVLRDARSGAFWLLKRGFDPGAGRWTFPGGFVDLGESVEDAARREAREEVGIDITINGLLGVYSRPQDPIVLVVFEALPHDTPQPSAEATEVQAFGPHEIPWDELAFWSTEQALRDALAAADRR
jgi:ADP-ribose pyrophosphatase YjhB (NUDIX family)